MFYAYVLRDNKGQLYKGSTNNLKRRLSEHKGGRTITTSRMQDLRLIYLEEFESQNEALLREKYFKTAAGRRFLKKVMGP